MITGYSRASLPLLTALLLGSVSAAGTEPRQRLGFFQASAPVQERGEETFLAVPTPEQSEKWLLQLTEEPHVAGTPNDESLAKLVRDRLKEYGFESSIVSYAVLLNYPKHVSLKLLEPAATSTLGRSASKIKGLGAALSPTRPVTASPRNQGM